jgi:hypothetical protein
MKQFGNFERAIVGEKYGASADPDPRSHGSNMCCENFRRGTRKGFGIVVLRQPNAGKPSQVGPSSQLDGAFQCDSGGVTVV